MAADMDEIKILKSDAEIIRFFLETEWASFVELCSDFNDEDGGTTFAEQIFKSLGGE